MTPSWLPTASGRAAALLYLAGALALVGALVSAAAALAYYAALDVPSLAAGLDRTLAASVAVAASAAALGAVVWLARRSPTTALALAAAMFVAVRCVVVMALDGTLTSDWSAYDRLAIGWTLGAPPVANWPMGYPIILGEAYRLLGAGSGTAELLNLLLGGVGVALLAAWVHTLAGRAAAAIAVALLAVAPSQALFTLLVGTETLYVTVLLAVVLLLTLTLVSIRRGDGGRRVAWLAAGTGILLGATLWVRPTGLVLAPLIALLPLVVVRTRYGATVGLVVLLAFGAMLAPIVVANKVYLDRWSPSTSLFAGWQLYIGFNIDSMGRWNDADRQRVNEAVPGFRDFQLVHEYARGRFEPGTLRLAAERDAAAFRLAVERIRADGIRLPLVLPFKYFFAWGPADAPVRYVNGLPVEARVVTILAQAWWMAVLAGAAWWLLRHGRADPLAGLIVSAIVVSVALSLLVLQVLPRYHEYVVPLIAGLAAMSLAGSAPPRPNGGAA